MLVKSHKSREEVNKLELELEFFLAHYLYGFDFVSTEREQQVTYGFIKVVISVPPFQMESLFTGGFMESIWIYRKLVFLLLFKTKRNYLYYSYFIVFERIFGINFLFFHDFDGNKNASCNFCCTTMSFTSDYWSLYFTV